ncbi:MAG: hypothetical protein ACRC1G_03760 [Bradyrhizobium sp.]|nr:hypothetical protein [Bradyrhizobium sp.]
MSDWQDDIIHWARRSEAVWELWLLTRNGKALTVGVVLAPADGDHSRTLGDFSLQEARWRNELRAITGHQVMLEPMVPGYPGDKTIRSAGSCLWKRAQRGNLPDG